METAERTGVELVDLATTPLRELNRRLHELSGETKSWRILNPNGAHAIACGLDAEIDVEIQGHVGYYCAGMNKLATVRVHGNAGPGLAENLMSGAVLAETDDWVAMSSEYRAIAVLPGAADARLWEPEPSVVYAWEKVLV